MDNSENLTGISQFWTTIVAASVFCPEKAAHSKEEPLYVLAVGDIDGDRKDDLVTPEGVWISNGDGTFDLRFSADHPWNRALLIDLNGDGMPELLTVTDAYPGRITQWLNVSASTQKPNSHDTIRGEKKASAFPREEG